MTLKPGNNEKSQKVWHEN